jgi:hypothetical protein
MSGLISVLGELPNWGASMGAAVGPLPGIVGAAMLGEEDSGIGRFRTGIGPLVFVVQKSVETTTGS